MLHNRGEVAEQTRNKILKIVNDLNYQPNILASTLASKKPVLFVTLFPQPPSPDAYWNKPLAGVRKRIAELQPYGIISENLTFSQVDSADFTTQAARVIELNPDGVILAPFYSREAYKLVDVLKQKHIPFIFIDSELKNAGPIAYVGQDSFRSGMVAGKLMGLITPPELPVIVVHFAKEMDNMNHLVERERGFYEWFRIHQPEKSIITREVGNTTDSSWELDMLTDIGNLKPAGIFVTNSKVFMLARLLEQAGINGIRLIGHDLLEQNRKYLRQEIVSFLICQRPEEQGYNAIDRLFQHVIRRKKVDEANYTSIDIVTSENVDYYREFKH